MILMFVVKALKERKPSGQTFLDSCCSRRCNFQGRRSLTKKELKEKKKSGLVYRLLHNELGAKIDRADWSGGRVTVPGHTQRGGEPCAYDRVLSTRLGAEAAGLDPE